MLITKEFQFSLTSMYFCSDNGSQCEPNLFSNQHSSKHLFVFSRCKSHTGLERHEGKKKREFTFLGELSIIDS